MPTIQASLAQNVLESRRHRIGLEIQYLINQCRIPADQSARWINRAMEDETVLNELRALPQNKPGVEGLAFGRAEVVSPDIKNLSGEILRRDGMPRAQLIAKNRKRLLEVCNTASNTVDSNLKRVTIMAETMRAFARRLMPITAFSTRFDNVPLSGTDTVSVPYYDLQTAASTDWNASNGYVMGDTATGAKLVTINKRKYQAIQASSSDICRQPFLNIVELAQQNADKLAYDVLTDVLSLVVAANYSSAIFTGAASTFDLSTVAGFVETLKSWVGKRTIAIDTSFLSALLKDGWIVANPASDSTALSEGTVSRLMGFGMIDCPNIPSNSENLAGFVAHQSAAVVAVCPVQPAESVVDRLSRVEIVTDPQTGMSFTHRMWGNADYDVHREIIECSYGYVKGNTSALQRIVTT